MSRQSWSRAGYAGSLVLLLVWCIWATVPAQAQSGAPNGEWRTYGGDLESTRYAALDQINAENFGELEVAWRFKTDNLGPQPEFNFQATPLMVGGRLYLTAGTRRAAVALDAGTGEMLWMHRIDEGERGAAAPRRLSGRGLAYWSDGQEERILYVTPGYLLVALDAKTGARVAGFGRGGIVDLKEGLDQEVDPITGDVGLHAAPVVAKDVVIVGAAHISGSSPRGRSNVKGYVRGFDVRTGKRLWIFRTIPRPGEFGNDTWLNDSWSYTGNTGVWTQVSVDEELETAYLPVEMPTGDYYGGYRPGNGLFGESLVAVDLHTGERKWHYQLVHHGLWDYDLPSAPILADITVDGRAIKAVAQPTKQGWVYVFNRVTGEPVWPIEERSVPAGDVPGEWYAPTQPFVTKPPAFDRQGVSIDDLIDFTPELRAEAVELVSRYKIGPLFTPPVISRWGGPRGTLMLPSINGGANWQAGSFDPETKIMYLFSITAVSSVGLVPGDPERNADFEWVRGTAPNPSNRPDHEPGTLPEGEGKALVEARCTACHGLDLVTNAAYTRDGWMNVIRPMVELPEAEIAAVADYLGKYFANIGGGGLNIQGLPLVKPPYGRITALDLNQGEIVWQIPHGETPDHVKNHPALEGLTIPRTGRRGFIGVLTTKTLVVAGEGGFFTTPNGQRGAMLRAYDKATGEEVGAVNMPAPQTGLPMTYMLDGRQYIAVAIAGQGYSGELLVFRLPRQAAGS